MKRRGLASRLVSRDGRGDPTLVWAEPALHEAASEKEVRCILIGPGADAAVVDAAQHASDHNPWLVLLDEESGATYEGTVDLVVSPRAPLTSWTLALSGSRSSIRLNLMALSALSLFGGEGSADEEVERKLAEALGVDRCHRQMAEPVTSGATRDTLVMDETSAYSRELDRGLALGAPLVNDSGKWCFALELERNNDYPRLAFLSDRTRIFSPQEVLVLQEVVARFARELQWRSRVDVLARELFIARQSPGTDRLGIWNRAAIESLLEAQYSGVSRGRAAPSVAVIDIVGLGAVNNAHGHVGGDEVIRQVAASIKRSLRNDDLLGRFGGDELVVVFTGTKAEVAAGVLERVLATARKVPIEMPNGTEISVDLSAGLTAMEGPGDSAVSAMERARGAATQAQGAGEGICLFEAGGAVAAATSRETPARILGGTYRLLHEISRGGMGVVYRGQDVALGRPVAVKMLRPDLVDDLDLLERFRIEARILAQLRHPNLVQIYSFGEHEGENYFVMELVEGESVEEALERLRMERGHFTLRRVGMVATEIAGALDALHSRGIVHRDVKPANIILAPFSNRAVLVDVGIAWRQGDTGLAAGTPGFIAPEAMAQSAFSAQSDVYALAATLYAMIAQEEAYPFEDDIMELFHRQQSEAPASLAARDSRLAPVDSVLQRAMSPRLQNRPATAGDFAKELNSAIAAAHRIRSDTMPPEQENTAPGTSSAPTSEHRVRRVVFRALPRVVGVNPAERLRTELVASKSPLAVVLDSQGSPLDWVDASLFEELLTHAGDLGWESSELARNLARAAVRLSFRRFFPVSSATLDPAISLGAIDSIWRRYHSWGQLVGTALSPTKVLVRVESESPPYDGIIHWLEGALEQIVTISGGRDVTMQPHDGARLAYDIEWKAAPRRVSALPE